MVLASGTVGQFPGGTHRGRLPVDAVELDLVPLLGGPADPGRDALDPLPVAGLHACLDLAPRSTHGVTIDAACNAQRACGKLHAACNAQHACCVVVQTTIKCAACFRVRYRPTQVGTHEPMPDGGRAITSIRKEQLPRPKLVANGPVVFLGLPVVELAHQRHGLGCRRPLAVPHAWAAVALAAIEAIVLVPCNGDDEQRWCLHVVCQPVHCMPCVSTTHVWCVVTLQQHHRASYCTSAVPWVKLFMPPSLASMAPLMPQ